MSKRTRGKVESEAFRDFIRKEAERRGHTSLRAFADAVGIPPSNIIEIAAGKRGATLDFMIDFAEKTGTNLNLLIELRNPGSTGYAPPPVSE